MATIPTQNSVPSESPRDLKFNAGKIDEFVTSLVNTYVDRFGNEHYTIEGLRWLAQQAIAQYGWILVDSFQDGAELNLPNQALRDENTGEYYRWDGALPKHVDAGSTPASSGGTGKGAWISVGDAALRTEILSTQPGAISIEGFTLRFTPMAFGAKADGITNDTLAFAACISSAPEGSTIDLQGGTYLAEVTITKNNIKITNGVIKAPYNATKGCVVADGKAGISVSYVKTIVDKANKALYTSPNVSGVHFENCQDVSVDHVVADGSKNDTYALTGSWGCPIHAYQCSGVTISFCNADNADKEGIMTRSSDDVWISNCTSMNAGYSCIGTSGGNRATITRCRATGSGATAITMNSQSSIVSHCTVDAGGAFNGILIGHDHESQAYGIDCMITHNLVKDCTGSGVTVSKGQHVLIDGNIITNVTEDGVHVHSMTGNTINLISVIVSNNIVTNAGRTGIWCYESDPTLNISYLIDNNQLDKCGLYAVRVNANRDISISRNIMRAITDIAIFIRPSDNSTSNTSDSINISGNTLIGSTASAITLTPAKMVSIRDNNLYGFNSSNGAFSTAIALTGSVSGVNYTLPNELQINGNIIEGTIGASTTIINISTDNNTGANRQLQINSNLIRNSGVLLTYPSARYLTPQIRNNTKGLDPTLVSVSVPASGTLAVNNSNQTAYSNPRLTARNAAGLGVYVSSIVDGTVTLSNNSATTASVNLEW
ncbi:right-handed parallel beta-helix repeat-containing protein [Escherichia coli]|nr:right-handed parallel beta-helix repeat-containing protein [Escherichia coli]